MNIHDITVMLERHGREEVGDNVSPVDVIGWLTSMFPVRFQIDDTFDIGALLVSVKETMRSVPDGGLGYGLLREKADDVSRERDIGLLFNYLGVEEGPGSFRRIRSSEMVFDGSRNIRSERQHPLEINAYYKAYSLHMNFAWSKQHFKTVTIEKLTELIVEVAKAIVEHCRNEQSGKYTPSDFPDSGLSQGDLDQLFDSL